MEKYTVDYFIGKFEAIPENRWTTGAFSDGRGAYCANGHCGAYKGRSIMYDMAPEDETAGLQKVFFCLCVTEARKTNEIRTRYSITAARINNGDDPRYEQATPKQRILAALADIKRMEEEKKQQALKEVSLLLQGIDFSEEKKEPAYAE